MAEAMTTAELEKLVADGRRTEFARSGSRPGDLRLQTVRRESLRLVKWYDSIIALCDDGRRQPDERALAVIEREIRRCKEIIESTKACIAASP